MAHAVGIDVGTTNVKVALVRDDGVLVATAVHAVPSAPRHGDVHELDAEAMWSAVVGAVHAVVAEAPDAVADVAVIGVCSQYSTIIPVDADGLPVAPALLWSDLRGGDHALAILGRDPEAFGLWVEHHGIPPIGGGLSLAHLLHLQHDRPDVQAAAASHLEPVDYVIARLTGVRQATQATVVAWQLTDNRTTGTTGWDGELVARSGVDERTLPELLAVDAVVGPLRSDVAERLGLPAAAVVATGTTDTHTGVVATGASAPERAGLAIGTTTVVLGTVDAKREDLAHEILAMPGPFPGTHLVWAEAGLGGRAVAHVLEDVLAEPFDELDDDLAESSPGARGVLFAPWLSGSMAPSGDPDARGALLGLSLDTTRSDVVRATVEGVAHSARWLHRHVEDFVGTPAERIAVVGGAARSPGWCQVLADVLDRPVHVVDHPDRAVARAAALLALVRAGSLGRDDLDDLVEVAAVHEPDPSLRALHDGRQAQLLAAHEALAAVRGAGTP